MKISSVNVSKSTLSRVWSYFLKKSLMRKFSVVLSSTKLQTSCFALIKKRLFIYIIFLYLYGALTILQSYVYFGLRIFVNNSETRNGINEFFLALHLKFCHMTLGFSKKQENCEILKSKLQSHHQLQNTCHFDVSTKFQSHNQLQEALKIN